MSIVACDIKDISDWENFCKAEKNPSTIYRGLSSDQYQLTSTLGRFLNNRSEYDKNAYYTIIHEIVKKHPELCAPLKNLPDKLNIRSDGLTGDLYESFAAICQLRHLGFPSPILDWTEDLKIATFFAIADSHGKNTAAIYCLDERDHNHSASKVTLFKVSHTHIEEKVNAKFATRGTEQKSYYTFCVEDQPIGTLEYNFNLKPLNELFLKTVACFPPSNKAIQLRKILIHKDIQRDILKALMNDANPPLSYETIYPGEHHKYESTTLKDEALKRFFLTGNIDLSPVPLV